MFYGADFSSIPLRDVRSDTKHLSGPNATTTMLALG